VRGNGVESGHRGNHKQRLSGSIMLKRATATRSGGKNSKIPPRGKLDRARNILEGGCYKAFLTEDDKAADVASASRQNNLVLKLGEEKER